MNEEFIKLNEQMKKEHLYFQEYQKNGIPFIIIPVITPEHHEQMLDYRDKLIDGVQAKFVFEA